MVDRRQDMSNMDPPAPGSVERAIEVRRLRNHYLGLWAASRMGFSAEAGDYYAAEVARDGDVLAGDGMLVDRVLGDLEAYSGNTSEKEIWLELRRLDGIARSGAAETRSRCAGSHDRSDRVGVVRREVRKWSWSRQDTIGSHRRWQRRDSDAGS